MNISKDLIEIIFIMASLLVLVASSAFAFATFRAQLAMSKIELNITSNQLEFARKIQQNIDSNRVELGALKCEIRDIKGMLVRSGKFKERQGFPPENIPPHTDF